MPARHNTSSASKLKRRASNSAARPLPKPPSLAQTIGPSFILLGIALGSGELVLWPYLAATYGLGLLWGGLLGISLQYVLNTETMRYSLARGESVFVGFRKLHWIWPFWFIVSTFIPWSIPGFSSASAQLFTGAFGIGGERWLAVALLLLTGLILSVGRTLYQTMEKFQQTVIFVSLPILLSFSIFLANRQDWVDAAWGLVGRGDGWWFFPPGLGIAAFLAAFAYSGAGGNLNLAQSYYIKEKGFGMGLYLDKISTLISGANKAMKLEGEPFTATPENSRRWKQWWWLITTEHFLVFWCFGFATIALMAILAKTLLYGQADGNSIAFLFQEGDVIQQRTHAIFRIFFLLAAGVMLFKTQLGVMEASARIISENILLAFANPTRKLPLGTIFYIIMWSQILLGILILALGIHEPRALLTAGALLNGAAMMTAFPLLYLLNTKHLPLLCHPGLIRKFAMGAGFSFFFVFFCFLLRDMF